MEAYKEEETLVDLPLPMIYIIIIRSLVTLLKTVQYIRWITRFMAEVDSIRKSRNVRSLIKSKEELLLTVWSNKYLELGVTHLLIQTNLKILKIFQ